MLGAAGPPSAPASAATGNASLLLDGASSDELLCSACVSKHRPQRWNRTCKSLNRPSSPATLADPAEQELQQSLCACVLAVAHLLIAGVGSCGGRCRPYGRHRAAVRCAGGPTQERGDVLHGREVGQAQGAARPQLCKDMSQVCCCTQYRHPAGGLAFCIAQKHPPCTSDVSRCNVLRTNP